MNTHPSGVVRGVLLALLLAAAPLGSAFHFEARAASEADPAEIAIAISLANMMRSAREVISDNQVLINDPNRGDKGLTGDVVLSRAVAKYRAISGEDPAAMDPASRHARLLQGQMEAIHEVVEENQKTINQRGTGFKGFIPALFGRLVNERFLEKMGAEAEMKNTAPVELVRNRKARPDAWERRIIEEKFLQPTWPKGQLFSETANSRGRAAARILVPEYYTASCLTCHGPRRGETDITGYPKEGAAEGDLGGVISITLFR